jgi:hypothetical protein
MYFHAQTVIFFSGKKRRENDDDVIQVAEKYRPEHALEPSDNSKGNGMPKPFSAQKKLGEGDYNEGGNIVSSSNVFTDRVRTPSCGNSLYTSPHRQLIPHYLFIWFSLCSFVSVRLLQLFKIWWLLLAIFC